MKPTIDPWTDLPRGVKVLHGGWGGEVCVCVGSNTLQIEINPPPPPYKATNISAPARIYCRIILHIRGLKIIYLGKLTWKDPRKEGEERRRRRSYPDSLHKCRLGNPDSLYKCIHGWIRILYVYAECRRSHPDSLYQCRRSHPDSLYQCRCRHPYSLYQCRRGHPDSLYQCRRGHPYSLYQCRRGWIRILYINADAVIRILYINADAVICILYINADAVIWILYINADAAESGFSTSMQTRLNPDSLQHADEADSVSVVMYTHHLRVRIIPKATLIRGTVRVRPPQRMEAKIHFPPLSLGEDDFQEE